MDARISNESQYDCRGSHSKEKSCHSGRQMRDTLWKPFSKRVTRKVSNSPLTGSAEPIGTLLRMCMSGNYYGLRSRVTVR